MDSINTTTIYIDKKWYCPLWDYIRASLVDTLVLWNIGFFRVDKESGDLWLRIYEPQDFENIVVISKIRNNSKNFREKKATSRNRILQHTLQIVENTHKIKIPPRFLHDLPREDYYIFHQEEHYSEIISPSLFHILNKPLENQR